MAYINQLLTDNTQYLRLDILPSIQKKAWEQAQNHSNAIARHNSYLNYVSLYTLLDWFTDELTEAETTPKPEIYPSENSLPSIWEVVNGAAIKLGKKRIVLIPCEISDLEEFSVPQEWVDIPEWAGDYYLAIQVNLEPEEDECWLEVCGFTTHRYLKNLGKYNPNERIYTMTLDNLIQDIAVMEITLPLKMQEEIPKLPNLLEVAAKKLLDFFGNSSIYSSRLRVNNVTFEEWAALLVNNSWRQQLYEKRMGLVTSSRLVEQGKIADSQSLIAHLTRWLQPIVDFVDEIWLSYEPIDTTVELARSRGQAETETISANDIAREIRILQSKKPEPILRTTAEYLGIIAAGSRNQEAIDALIHLLHTAQDSETRWQAAWSLGKIDPGNPQSAIQKLRIIDLGMQLNGHKIILMVGIMPKDNGKIGIWLSVKPYQTTELPANLKLSVLSEFGEKIPGLEVSAKNPVLGETGDKRISKVFSRPVGTRFRVQLTLNEASFTQEFLV